MKENEKNKEHVCYPPLDFSKKSIMNLCICGKRRRMKWVIKQRTHLLRNRRKISKQIKGKIKKNKIRLKRFVQQIKEKVCDGRGKWMGETKLLLDGKNCRKNKTRNNKTIYFLLACNV